VYQFGDQPRLYYGARSTNHQSINLLLRHYHVWMRLLCSYYVVIVLHNALSFAIEQSPPVNRNSILNIDSI
jgi:hypothetical protein